METRPRALVIAYDFPPHGAIGTMRTLRLVRQLHAEGWGVTVLTGSPRTYLLDTPVEPALEAQVPPGVEVLQVGAVRPFNALERLVRRAGGRRAAAPRASAAPVAPPRRRAPWVRAAVGLRDVVESALDIPDKESGWILPAIVAGLRHVGAAGRPDVIYSSAPPWSGQVVAYAIAALTGRPWVADFRDPWARAPWRDWRRRFRQRAASRLERRVVRRADAVIFVTRANVEEFTTFYGEAASSRFHLIPNGCDPAEIERVAALPPRELFVLLHAGTLYGPRTPLPVVQAIASAVRRGTLDPARFRLRLLGTVSLAMDLPAECRRLGLEEVVEFVPRVTRAESLREMKSASALLLIQTGTAVSVPGKAYEYLAAGRPVLALSDEGETADLIRASGVGVAVRPDEPVDRIRGALLEVVRLAASGCGPASSSLYDGRIHARTAAGLLREVARVTRSPRAGVVPEAGGAAHGGEFQP